MKPTDRVWSIGESETRIPIKQGYRTIAYIQIARDDYEVAHLVTIAPKLLKQLKMARKHVEKRWRDEGCQAWFMELVEIDALIAYAEGREDEDITTTKESTP